MIAQWIQIAWEFGQGFVAGDAIEEPTNAQVAGSAISGVFEIGDIRDWFVNLYQCSQGDPNCFENLGYTALAAAPLFWDEIKAEHKMEKVVVKAKKSVNQLQEDISKGKAPKGVERADKGKIFWEQDHIHLKDGTAINKDGTIKHGDWKNIPKAIRDWMKENGWKLP